MDDFNLNNVNPEDESASPDQNDISGQSSADNSETVGSAQQGQPYNYGAEQPQTWQQTQPQQPQTWQQTQSQQDQPRQNPYGGYSWSAPSSSPQPKKGGKAVAVLSILLAFTFILLIATAAAYGATLIDPDTPDAPDVSVINSIQNGEVSYNEFIKNESAVTVEPTEYSKLYEKCSKSCLSVVTDKALGSGFVIDTDGNIITNHHVIENAKSVSVKFYDGTEYKAEVVGSDSVSDIAVLKIEAEGLVPLALGNSDNVAIGESVVAIGTPYDLTLEGTMTPGIISGISRNIEVTNDFGTVVKTMTLLQTSAAINPGNSGGPLIDMAGQVIGITTLKLMDDYEGLGFAIPINDAITIANMILTHGEVSQRPGFVSETPRLNITIINIPDAVTSGILVSADGLPEGSMVTEVSRGSAIYRAGLEIYDIITEFNGMEVKSKEALTAELKKYSAGQTVTIKVFRLSRSGEGGEYITMSFVLDSAAVSGK